MRDVAVFVAVQVSWLLVMVWSFAIGGAFQRPRSATRLLIAGLVWTWVGAYLVTASAYSLL